jgi:SAM-dependent methyltransferase
MKPAQSGFQLNQGAPEQYQRHVGVIMRPFVDALVAAVVGRGDAVLDVACGTGFVARAAADVVGADGRVVGADVNGGMLAVAREVPHTSPCPVEWVEAPALGLPWDDDAFDVVTCQQGLQFMPDPAACLAEMARVTRVGGRIGVTVWAPVEQSPYMEAQMNLLRHAGDIDPKVVTQAFPEGGEDTVREWFAGASLTAVEVATLAPVIHLAPLTDYAPAHLRALPWSAPFFTLDAARRDAAFAGMANALGPFTADDGSVQVPFASCLATAVVSGRQ